MKMFIINSLFIFIICSAHKCKRDKECEEALAGITFINNSEKNIYFKMYWNYPDTVIGYPEPHEVDIIRPGGEFIRSAGRTTCWEVVLKDKKEWVYIFDHDTIKDLPWEVVRETNRGLLERRLIDLEYLQSTNFRVVYP